MNYEKRLADLIIDRAATRLAAAFRAIGGAFVALIAWFGWSRWKNRWRPPTKG